MQGAIQVLGFFYLYPILSLPSRRLSQDSQGTALIFTAVSWQQLTEEKTSTFISVLSGEKPGSHSLGTLPLCALWRISTAAREAGSVAELPADCKSAKYTDLDTRYSSQPVAVETLGPINDSAREFLFNLGRKISLQSGDDRESSLLFQRISVLIQRFNAIVLHDSFAQLWSYVTVVRCLHSYRVRGTTAVYPY